MLLETCDSYPRPATAYNEGGCAGHLSTHLQTDLVIKAVCLHVSNSLLVQKRISEKAT